MIKKNKLIFVIDCIYGMTGGTEKQINLLINNLNRNKFEILLICLMPTEWFIRNSEKFKCHVAYCDYNIFNHKSIKNIKAIYKLYFFIKQYNPDIVFCFFRTSCILAPIISRIFGVKSIISARRDYGEFYDKFYLLLLRFANLFVNMVVTNSIIIKHIVTQNEKFPYHKLHTIYNGIEIDHIDIDYSKSFELRKLHNIPKDKFIIGIVAGLRPMKNHHIFLLAAKDIISRRDDVHFLIIGDGPLYSKLRNLSRQLNLTSHLQFLGWQNNIIPYLSLIDIGVNCSSQEGLSNAIMEYMLYKVPAVVSKAGGNEELVQNNYNGLTYDLYDYKALSSAIIYLIQNPGKMKQYANNAQLSLKNNFGITKMIKNYESLFSNC